MPSKREQLARWSTLVADTGELNMIRDLKPEDATTNPSLLLAVARDTNYAHLLDDARREAATDADIGLLCDTFATLTGRLITEAVPGLVSTEVDARLSFDTGATIERARRLARLYRELGVERDRFLIKIAGTWEGIRATEVLELEGIRCNVTLIFSETQALAAAQAGATLISPFVGRIYDWHVKHGTPINTPEDDPGVQSVRRIFSTFKALGMDTIVMGASFRNTAQIEALAGCDRLTISPTLLNQLHADQGALTRVLDATEVEGIDELPEVSEAAFRWAINHDPMASDLLADGIRRFAADQESLETLLNQGARATD